MASESQEAASQAAQSRGEAHSALRSNLATESSGEAVHRQSAGLVAARVLTARSSSSCPSPSRPGLLRPTQPPPSAPSAWMATPSTQWSPAATAASASAASKAVSECPVCRGAMTDRLEGFRLKRRSSTNHCTHTTNTHLQALRGLRATLFAGYHSSPLESWELS